MNPYSTQPGYPARVAYAVAMLKRLADGRDHCYCKLTNEWYSRAHDRKMDNCLENDDGEAVIWEIMRRGHADFTPWRGIEMFTGNGECLAQWKAIAAYRGPQCGWRCRGRGRACKRPRKRLPHAGNRCALAAVRGAADAAHLAHSEQAAKLLHRPSLLEAADLQ